MPMMIEKTPVSLSLGREMGCCVALRVGRYEIRRMDRLNLRAYEYRVPEQNGKAKTNSPKWMPIDAYFGNLKAALAWVYERLVWDAVDSKDMDAAGLLRECMRIRDEVIEAVGKSEVG